ncbi:ankyrin repeat domain-containing protein [Paenibacillus wenxiniae]|uniref:Ankyrin repeat domain-containing protein n=1 Tax=Paenibacillus wenxiniae TaxID=1636843 RepID=A0ABW4RMH4_9BACL
MYTIKDKGKFDTLPELAVWIYEGRLQELRAAWAEGQYIEVNQPLSLSKHTELTPLELALMMGKRSIVEALLEQGVELNDPQHPSILTAVRYASEHDVRRLYAAGAKLDITDHLNKNAYDAAYYGKKQHIPLLHELGLDIRQHAGAILRKAVSNHDFKTIKYLVEQGVDINYNEPDQVFPYRATPLTVAVRYGFEPIARYLIEHGADITICETNGDRAYTIAVSEKHMELAAYLKSLEPPQFHNLSNKLHSLSAYKLPAALVQALSDEPIILTLPENELGMSRIEFFTLTDTIEMKLGRTRLLRLSSSMDSYSDLHIVWHPTSRKIGCYDEEHQKYHALASWNDFIANPVAALEQIL